LLAVDTNILVRLFADDDPDQAARAAVLLRDNPIWIPKTVLLETEWVLRRVYGFDRERVAEALARLASSENVQLEDERAVMIALNLMAHQVDFADALHLASSSQATGFVTFDEQLAKRAKQLGSRGTVQVVKL
jgi:predicted nucleic-acid-binding protein